MKGEKKRKLKYSLKLRGRQKPYKWRMKRKIKFQKIKNKSIISDEKGNEEKKFKWKKEENITKERRYNFNWIKKGIYYLKRRKKGENIHLNEENKEKTLIEGNRKYNFKRKNRKYYFKWRKNQKKEI